MLELNKASHYLSLLLFLSPPDPSSWPFSLTCALLFPPGTKSTDLRRLDGPAPFPRSFFVLAIVRSSSDINDHLSIFFSPFFPSVVERCNEIRDSIVTRNDGLVTEIPQDFIGSVGSGLEHECRLPLIIIFKRSIKFIDLKSCIHICAYFEYVSKFLRMSMIIHFWVIYNRVEGHESKVVDVCNSSIFSNRKN